MTPVEQPPQPTELIYPPEPSWLPALTGAGLALILVGLFIGWVVIVAGAVLFLPALLSWIGRTRESIARLPRRQRPVTAVLPAVPPRRRATE
ncbi:MAG TPA: hypothetical protein VEK39_13890 [Solirubrobacterales bacterium]|nr:hypothetical protein [Solirubrobacterales bacterium]